MYRVVGLDLAGSEKRNSGFCKLEWPKISVFTLKKNEEIIREIRKACPNLIAIDAPLSLPFGRKSLEEKSEIHFRECDKELLKRKIKFFPITLGPMRKLTERGIYLRKILEKDFKVIEVFPGAAYDIWGLKRKDKKGILFFYKKVGLKIEEKLSQDEIDAIACALVGYMFLLGFFEEIGNEKEGKIILPKK